jgi:tetratricopeptide (TPR) repeat protein
MFILKNMKHAIYQFSLFFRSNLLCGFLLSFLGVSHCSLSFAETLERLPELFPNQAVMEDSQFSMGVKAYREGDYIQARRTFYSLHKPHPENTKVTYYLAITEAQLGRFQNAKKLYEEILSLEPHGETADLAKEGLKYLPAETALDLPPRFNKTQTNETNVNKTNSSSPAATTPPPVNGTNTAPGGMSQQDWMAWQTMMGQTGMGNNNMGNNNMGINMMPWMMQQSASPNNPNAMGGYDPNAMSNMLMNQMLQNFSLDSSKDDNR